jgi:hypothetical protein
MNKQEISISQYNHLYNIVENEMNLTIARLGLSPDDVRKRTSNSEELKVIAGGDNDTTYWLYKLNANAVVNQLLDKLNIIVDEHLKTHFGS